MIILDIDGNETTEDALDMNAGHFVVGTTEVHHEILDGKPIPWDETVECFRYTLYTAQEIAERTIAEMKAQLAASDYNVLKAMESIIGATSITGLLAALAAARKTYAEILADRARWREEITKLEAEK